MHGLVTLSFKPGKTVPASTPRTQRHKLVVPRSDGNATSMSSKGKVVNICAQSRSGFTVLHTRNPCLSTEEGCQARQSFHSPRDRSVNTAQQRSGQRVQNLHSLGCQRMAPRKGALGQTWRVTGSHTLFCGASRSLNHSSPWASGHHSTPTRWDPLQEERP